nr:uncharacterized protein LOC125966813 [Syngnathus scovelli]
MMEKNGLVCEIAVCGLQLCLQHHCATKTHLQTRQAGPQYLPLQLATGLPLSEASGGTCWRQNLRQHHAEHGGPQGCVLSPLLFTLLTHDRTASYSDNRIVKFADDTTLGQQPPAERQQDKEIVVDFRKGHTQHLLLTINGAVVERVSSSKFLGVHISEDLSWSANTASLAKKAQRHLYVLRKLRQASAPPAVMTTFYRGTIECPLQLYRCLGW